jgi:hypothetical protein
VCKLQCISVYWGTGRTWENDVKPQDNHTAGKITLPITNQRRKKKKKVYFEITGNGLLWIIPHITIHVTREIIKIQGCTNKSNGKIP